MSYNGEQRERVWGSVHLPTIAHGTLSGKVLMNFAAKQRDRGDDSLSKVLVAVRPDDVLGQNKDELEGYLTECILGEELIEANTVRDKDGEVKETPWIDRFMLVGNLQMPGTQAPVFLYECDIDLDGQIENWLAEEPEQKSRVRLPLLVRWQLDAEGLQKMTANQLANNRATSTVLVAINPFDTEGWSEERPTQELLREHAAKLILPSQFHNSMVESVKIIGNIKYYMIALVEVDFTKYRVINEPPKKVGASKKK
jgi:hypothetical protein